jgi:alpha-mannosidase
MTSFTYLTLEQRVKRLIKHLSELELWEKRQTVLLDQWTFNGKPLAAGKPWPDRDGVAVFAHPAVEVPQDWPLDDTRLQLDLGGEGLLQIEAAGTAQKFGLDPYHSSFPLAGRQIAVTAECVARSPFGVPNREARLARAELVWVEIDLVDLVMTVRQVVEFAQTLGGYAVSGPSVSAYMPYRTHPDHSAPHEAIEAVLDATETALRQLAWPTATGDYVARVAPGREAQTIWRLPEGLATHPAGLNDDERASVGAARDALRASLRALGERYPHVGAIALTGHAHIDLAWLWPMAETRRKALRTFHTAADLMDRYPEYRFNQSTAQLYAFVEEDDPELFARIKEKVAAGQWEPIGAMWVEPDTNMPTAESFVRQLLYGIRYFDRAFGRRSRVNWLPDCFGFSPALPQILRLAGVDSFFTHKVTWSEIDPIPFDLFWWEGLDGSRVLAHTFNNPAGGYNGDIGPRAAVETWKNYRGKHLNPESLLAIGWGDGGGGPTAEMLERTRLLADFPVIPALRAVDVSEWYGDIHRRNQSDSKLPVWVGEIYLEFHRGTLTTQGKTKFLHRRAERGLIAAETLASMATMLGAPAAASLEPEWRILLRNQFHDILPGSSIREVYEVAERELAGVVAAGREVLDHQLGSITERLASAGSRPAVLVVNPDLSPRVLRIETPATLPHSQTVEGGSVLSGRRTIPGLSAAIVTASAGAPSGLSARPDHIENEFIRVDVATDGTLRSVYDKGAGRECLDGRGNQIWAYVDKPRDFDAWDIEEDYPHKGEEILATAQIEVVEKGPHRAALKIIRRFRDSEIVQTVRLWANSARLEFKTDIDWHQRRILLKARFPLAIRADHATFECAAGVIQRPTHRNTSWDQTRFEVVAHRFADLSEHGYGVALLNDGKYGHHALHNELGLSLLRSPVYPDPLADEGRQSFTYALYPHEGDWLSGGVLAEAEDLNQPLLARLVTADTEWTWTAAAIDGLGLGLSGLKPAEDGSALILRVYEPAGARGKIGLKLAAGWKLRDEVNLLEDRIGPADVSFSPFQIHSWRIEKAK